MRGCKVFEGDWYPSETQTADIKGYESGFGDQKKDLETIALGVPAKVASRADELQSRQC